jgi:uncharacterized membrane protein
MATTGYAQPESMWGATLPKVWRDATPRSRFGDAVLVVFLLAQCFDGVFTYVGVQTFGMGIEANPIVAGLMLHFGHGTGLIGAKMVAAALGITLHLRRVHVAVALLAVFYLGAAVVPWTAILFL